MESSKGLNTPIAYIQCGGDKGLAFKHSCENEINPIVGVMPDTWYKQMLVSLAVVLSLSLFLSLNPLFCISLLHSSVPFVASPHLFLSWTFPPASL